MPPIRQRDRRRGPPQILDHDALHTSALLLEQLGVAHLGRAAHGGRRRQLGEQPAQHRLGLGLRVRVGRVACGFVVDEGGLSGRELFGAGVEGCGGGFGAQGGGGGCC